MTKKEKLERKQRRAELILELKEHDGMKDLLKELDQLTFSINSKLLSREKLETFDREMLLTDRERCEWLKNVFLAQEHIIKNTSKRLESYE